jgi:hypothetical protein
MSSDGRIARVNFILVNLISVALKVSMGVKTQWRKQYKGAAIPKPFLWASMANSAGLELVSRDLVGSVIDDYLQLDRHQRVTAANSFNGPSS